MQTIAKIFEKFIEISLFLILLILPFSYPQITIKQSVFFIFIIFIISFVLIKKITSIKTEYWIVFIIISFILIFDFSEKVNFIGQYQIPLVITKRIPLSTILLSLATFLFLVKGILNNDIFSINQTFIRYLIYSGLFLLIIMLIFYPILYNIYHINFDSNFLLLSKITKYIFIAFLITDYQKKEKNSIKLGIGILVTLIISVVVFAFTFS